jgi:hypothetical protein
MTALVVAFGLSQWRRRSVRQTMAQLERSGAAMGERDGWIDVFWMRVPLEAGVPIQQAAPGEWRLGDANFSSDEGVAYATELEQRLRTFGVRDVTYLLIENENHVTRFVSLDDLLRVVSRATD